VTTKQSVTRARTKTSSRPRNAAATRQAILESALVAFTRSGYDGVGVREISRRAGVTAMLVNRYFGSKEQLFSEVVDVAYSRRGILTDEVTMRSRNVATLSKDVAVALVAQTAPEAQPLAGFMLLLKSASNERAAVILRDGIVRHFEKPLAALLPGAKASVRAALFLSLIAGFQVIRQVIGNTALTEAQPDSLSQQLEALFRLLVEPVPSARVPGRQPSRPRGNKNMRKHP
jgi:AcrR family transcriptional regulator